MKIVFIQPPKLKNKVINTEPLLPRCTGIPAKAPYIWPPIGLAYTAAYVSQYTDAKTEILDAQAKGLNLNETAVKVKGDFAVINMGMPSAERDLKLCNAIKTLNPETKTILIGNYATFFHKELIKQNAVDFVIRGEPEKPLATLIKNKEKSQRNWEGITWKENGKIIESKKAVFIKNLDKMPFAARELLDYKKYYDILIKGKKLDFIISARGCPYSCKFCASKAFSSKYRQRSAENVIREVEKVKANGKDDITFFDDTFTADKKRVEEICSEIKKNSINWRCLSRVDTVNKKLLEKMYSSGCYQIHFGVESGNAKMLKLMDKGTNLKKTREIFKACTEIGIETVAFFVLGYPGETLESARQTIDFAKELKADFATFNTFTPLPGSPVFSEFNHKGNWEKYDLASMSFCSIQSEELLSITQKAYKEFYFNTKYFPLRMKKAGMRAVSQNLKFWAMKKGCYGKKYWKKINNCRKKN